MPIIDNNNNKRASSKASQRAGKQVSLQTREPAQAQRTIGETRYEKKIANYVNYRTTSFSSDCASASACACKCVSDWIRHAAQTMSFVQF